MNFRATVRCDGAVASKAAYHLVFGLCVLATGI